jgi:predicted thioesterase
VPHLEAGEAGIGTAVSVEHLAPSWVGDTLTVTARCTEVRDGRLTCECRATDGFGRELGRGSTVQAVLPAELVAARVGEEARRSRRAPSAGPGADRPVRGRASR